MGFGRGGAGAVFSRIQPSRFWRELRFLIETLHTESDPALERASYHGLSRNLKRTGDGVNGDSLDATGVGGQGAGGR